MRGGAPDFPRLDGRRHVQAQVDEREILEIVGRHNAGLGGVIAILEEVQTACGYLPEEALRIVAKETGRSMVDLYGVATFYRSFSLRPRGKHLVCVCLGTACHVRGAPRVAEEFERQLGVKAGETTENKEFTLDTVNCLGACALGPVTVIDGRYLAKVQTSRAKQLLEDARRGASPGETGEDTRVFPIEASCPLCNRSLMDAGVALDGHPSIRITVSFDHRHGSLRLSSLYGSSTIRADCEVPPGDVATFYCPHCHEGLTATARCALCEAPMASLLVRGGGTVHICSRRGCAGHMLDIR